VLFAPDFEPCAVLSAGEQWLSLDKYAAVSSGCNYTR
jgi:hypothetical protein